MDLRRLRQILKVCADDTRLRILNLLSSEEHTVNDIADCLELNQPTISKHLSRFRLLRLVVDRREGNSVYYSLSKESDVPEMKIIRFILSQFSGLPTFVKDRGRLKEYRLF